MRRWPRQPAEHESLNMSQSAHNKDTVHLDLPDHGAASAWTVVIDELPGSKDWLLEIDSPQVYLTFQVADIAALARAVDLLNSTLVIRLPGRKHPFVPNSDDVALGHFGEAAVHLLRDNEGFPRCFLVIEQESGATLRVRLNEGDIRTLAEAITHAIADFPASDKGSS
jgi:hypothetical protein